MQRKSCTNKTPMFAHIAKGASEFLCRIRGRIVASSLMIAFVSDAEVRRGQSMPFHGGKLCVVRGSDFEE